MSDLTTIALEFCRECLGWEDAAGSHDINTVFEHLHDQPSLAFPFTELNAVMEAVRGWRDTMQDALDEHVTVTLSCASGQYIGHAFIGTIPPTTVTSDSPCQALMAACIAAARRLLSSSNAVEAQDDLCRST